MKGDNYEIICDLIAGTISGCSASLVGQPIDTIRVRVQSSIQRPPHGVVALSRNLWSTEGARGFFRGFVPPLLAMGPRNAIGFAAHGFASRKLEAATPGSQLATSAMAGVFAGLMQCCVIVPADRIKCYQQVYSRVARKGLQQMSATATIRLLVREQGVARGLFTGAAATAARQGPSAAVYFGTYHLLKQSWCTTSPDSDKQHLPFMRALLAGGLAGVSGYACNYPFDVVKSYIQTRTAKEAITMREAMVQLHAAHGVSWMIRGLGPTLMRAFLLNAVNFAAYETILCCL